MATSDIVKEAVFDDRVVQHTPAFAVSKGSLSLTAVPFQGISQTTTQHTYNINVPSQNIFVDRAVDWTSTCPLQVSVAPISVPLTVNQPVLTFGQDCALTNFPLHSLVGTMTASINDTTVSMNTSDVLKQVLRLTSYADNKKSRTCPTMDDTYQSYNSAYGAMNNPLNGWADSQQPAFVPNGAYPNVIFTNATGDALSLTVPGTYAATAPDGTAQTISFVNGVPIRDATNDAKGYTIFIQFTSTEKLVLSPFIFANSAQWETGLFGCNSIQIVCNMIAPSRVLRSTTQNGRTINSVVYRGSTFSGSQMLFQFLTPSLDLNLPPKSSVEYLEYPRYISNFNGFSTAVGATEVLSSQSIVLPQIPDMLLIYCRPQSYTSTTEADWMFPPVRISLSFDNFAGLLSSHQQIQLYQIAVHNGLDMDYAEWIGSAKIARTGGNVSTVGGFLVLKPGVDFSLQSGQASGLAGSFTLQYDLTVRNNTSAVVNSYQIVTVAVNGGFFESQSGSSRVIKSVLSEADIISAPPAGNTEGMRRLVGHGFLSNLGSAFTKAKEIFNKGKDIYEKTKPYISQVKNMLPDTGLLGDIKSGATSLGYGSSGGSGMSGGRNRRSLASRLM